jgi:hypothetical protein
VLNWCSVNCTSKQNLPFNSIHYRKGVLLHRSQIPRFPCTWSLKSLSTAFLLILEEWTRERERESEWGIIDFRNQVRQSPRNWKWVLAKPRQVCTQSIFITFKNIFSHNEWRREKNTEQNTIIFQWYVSQMGLSTNFFNHGESHSCMPHPISTYIHAFNRQINAYVQSSNNLSLFTFCTCTEYL